MRAPNPHSLISPKSTVLIGQNRVDLGGWSYAALTGWGKPQSRWLSRVPGAPLEELAQLQEHSAGGQLRAGLSLKCGLSERFSCRNGC